MRFSKIMEDYYDFKEDELVLVRSETGCWMLARFWYYEDGLYHTDSGSSYTEEDIMPYHGNEHYLR